MKITGELLKTERINLKLSVQDVATSLKLSAKVVKAIESGDLDKLPSKTFVRGFVKSYAQLLKLDVEAVMRQFQEEMGSTSPLPKTPPPMPSSPEDEAIKAPRPTVKQTSQNYSVSSSSTLTSSLKDADNKKKIIFMIMIALALVFILVLSDKIIDSFNPNPNTIAAIATSADSTPAPADTAPQNNPKAASVSDSTTSAASKEASKDITPVKPDLNAVTAENGFEKSSGAPVEILLEAKKDTEIFYAKGDAAQLVSLKLTANQVQILRSPAGLYLKIVDPAAIKLSVNGAYKKISSNGKKEIKLTF